MAFRILRICTESTNLLKSYSSTNNVFQQTSINRLNLLKTYVQPTILSRNVTFFKRVTAEQLWDGVTSVSNAGRRRGRAKSILKKKDLNKGQYLGAGKVQMVYPGLNAPAIRGSVPVKQHAVVNPVEKTELAVPAVLQQKQKRRFRQHPLNRGWTSAKVEGRNIGSPVSRIPGETFNGFDTYVLENKFLASMTGNLGRKGQVSAFVVTGNRNGVAGFAVGKGGEPKKAQSAAKNKAGHRLIHIKRRDEHTILHDVAGQFGQTKVFVKKMYPGYGLVCHRVLKACCNALGIHDIYIKSEKGRNTQNLVKAFFIALLKQKTYQEIADDTKLHVVEVRPEQGYYPNVLASPAEVKSGKLDNPGEMDFTQYVLDGNVVLQRPHKAPFYTKLPSWQSRLKRLERVRDQDTVKLRLMAQHGKLHSFLTKKHPEAFIKYRDPNKN